MPQLQLLLEQAPQRLFQPFSPQQHEPLPQQLKQGVLLQYERLLPLLQHVLERVLLLELILLVLLLLNAPGFELILCLIQAGLLCLLVLVQLLAQQFL